MSPYEEAVTNINQHLFECVGEDQEVFLSFSGSGYVDTIALDTVLLYCSEEDPEEDEEIEALCVRRLLKVAAHIQETFGMYRSVCSVCQTRLANNPYRYVGKQLMCVPCADSIQGSTKKVKLTEEQIRTS